MRNEKKRSFLKNPFYIDLRILMDQVSFKNQFRIEKLENIMINISKVAENQGKSLKNKNVLELFQAINKVITLI